ncbi:MAG: SufD family Fe-S cluster assembly protein, partial [Janthinobacterium lividum]
MSALPIKLPTRRTEDWRWADLSGLEALAAAGPANDAHPDVSPLWLDVPGPRLLFIDGRLVAGSSRLDEVEIAVFDGEMPVHPLAVKAVAQAGAGLRLRLGVDSPEIGTVQIVNFGTRGAAHVVHRIILDEDAHASVIETYAGQGWSNGFVDIVLARGARLMRTVRVLKGGGAHTELAQVSVAGAASYTGSVLVTGCDSARIETHALLAGPGAYAQSDGVLLGR